MTLMGRFLVRVISRVMAAVLIVAALAAFSSDVPGLKWLGLILALFLADRFFHLDEPDRPMSELPHSGRANIAAYIKPSTFSILEDALEKSSFGKLNFDLKILDNLLSVRAVRETVERLDVPAKELQQKLEQSLKEDRPQSSEEMQARLQNLCILAFNEALRLGTQSVDVFALFAALGKSEDPKFKKLITLFSLTDSDFERGAVFAYGLSKISFWGRVPRTLTALFFGGQRKVRHRVMNRAWTSRPTPNLDKYSIDFTDVARQGNVGFMLGHETEYRRLTETLSRSIHPNALLIGEAGSGKETIIAHLAMDIVEDKVPEALFDKRLVSLDLGLLVASANPQDLQARLKKIVEEIQRAGNIILYIPDIHNLVKTSGTAYLSAADSLLPVIMNDVFPVIGTTYPREFKTLIEPRSDFSGFFEVIPVQELSESDAEKVLMLESLMLEDITKVKVSLGAIHEAVKLAKMYFRDKLLPGSAEELLKAAASAAHQKGETFLHVDGVVSIAEEKTNIPLREAGGEESSRLLNMEDTIHARLVDQEEAVKAVSSALREYRSGLARKGGPIASFLFVGPTGVGKTELAKIIASIQFGSDEAMLRFDMTEYQNKESFIRFIGSPDQTVSGALTDAVRNKPFSLVLLDEFEKAYPDILNLFLQVLDDGRLTDNMGRVVDFGNAIIIATSNAKSEFISKSISEGKNISQISEDLKRQLVDVMKPELLNRFSKIIVFKNLEPKELLQISSLNLKGMGDLLGDQGIELSFTEEAIKRISELGYDPAFGARPLRRAIDENIKDPLSKALLSKEFVRGDKVEIGAKNGQFTFRKA